VILRSSGQHHSRQRPRLVHAHLSRPDRPDRRPRAGQQHSSGWATTSSARPRAARSRRDGAARARGRARPGEAQEDRLGNRPQADGRGRASDALLPARRHLLAARGEEHDDHGEQHLQRLAPGGCLAGSLEGIFILRDAEPRFARGRSRCIRCSCHRGKTFITTVIGGWPRRA